MVEKKCEQEPIQIVESMGDYDEVTEALRELEARKSHKLSSIVNEIIREYLGDAYMQATAFEILYDIDLNEALSLLREKMSELDINVITSAMDCLSADSEVIDLEIVRDIVEKLLQKYSDIELDNTCIDEGVKEATKWFKLCIACSCFERISTTDKEVVV